MNQCVIYGLIDPFTNQLRYVGKTMRFQQRKNEHLRLKKNPTTYSDKWLNSLINRGVKPQIEIFEEVDHKENLSELEIFYIAYFKSIGCNLCNHTYGGEGVSRFHSLEERIANSKRQGGKEFIDQDGNIYYSPMQASKVLKISRKLVRDILKKEEVSTSGYSFEYINEFSNIEEIKQRLYSLVENTKARRKILCSDGLLFKGVNECSRYYGITHSAVSGCCVGKRNKTQDNLLFCYFYPEKENYEEKLLELKTKLQNRLTYSYESNGKLHRIITPFQDKDGTVYQNINEAVKVLGVGKTTIREHLLGKYKNTEKAKFTFL